MIQILHVYSRVCSHTLIEYPYPTGHPEKSSLTLIHETPFSRSAVVQMVKVVIITDLEQRNKSEYKAENATDLPKTLQMPSLCCFHNLEPQNARLVGVKKNLNNKRSKGIFVREILKSRHRC